MPTARVLGLVTTVIMLVSLGVSVATGHLTTEGSLILGLAWGRMSLIDLYVGAALVGGWIAHREQSRIRILAWWAGLIIFGHLASAIYVVVAASSPDRETFWSGSNPSRDKSEAR